jgi:hypothetical protein
MKCEICVTVPTKAVFAIEAEEDQDNPKGACAMHAGLVADAVIDAWGEHGVVTIYKV